VGLVGNADPQASVSVREGGCYDQCGNCSTQCVDRRCRGERVVRIFEPQVLIICPNPPLPRAIANGNQTSPDGTKQIILYNSL
jgi:hypothetical protein